MLRFVRAANGTVRPDPDGREQGRGAYLCAESRCADKARDGRAFSRSFRAHVTIDPETLDFISAWQRDAFTR